MKTRARRIRAASPTPTPIPAEAPTESLELLGAVEAGEVVDVGYVLVAVALGVAGNDVPDGSPEIVVETGVLVAVAPGVVVVENRRREAGT